MSNSKPNAPAKVNEPRYDPIQERAPDRDVTKADKKVERDKALSPRQQIEEEMEANNLWIAQHRDDAQGVHQREAANVELTHRLIDIEAASQRQVDNVSG